MLTRLADFSYRRRWTVVGLWILALVGVSMASAAWAGEWRDSGRLDGTDSQRAYDLVEERFPQKAGEGATIVFAADDGVAAKRAAIDAYLGGLGDRDGVAAVVSPFAGDGQISADGTVAFATLDVTVDGETWSGADAIRERAGPLAAAGVTTEFSGSWFDEGEMPATELLGLAAAAVILLVAFGSIVAAGLPLVTAVVGIGIGVGTVGLWAAFVDTPDFTIEVASMIGIGVGIDYALFIVTRFREARGRGLDPHAATLEAAATAGRAVVFAGLTVMVSLLGMILMRLRFLNGLAVGTSTAVAVAVLAAITLLPALLALTGRRVRPLHAPSAARRPSFWERWSRVLQRRPWPAAAIGGVLLVALAAPTMWLRLGSADDGSAPTTHTVRRAYDLLAEGFTPGFAGPFVLATEVPDAQAAAELPGVVERLRADSGFAIVGDPQFNTAGDAAVITAIPRTSPQDVATDDLLHRLRDEILPAAEAGTGLDVSVGGVTASSSDFAYFIGQRLPWFIGAVLVISFLLLMVTFRSVLVPLKAVILNLLSIGAAYGVMVMVFQWGWLGSLVGVGQGGPIEPWAPMMLFAIVFGLSMDYEVFLLARIRERYDRSGDNSSAVAEAVASTARVISAAAAIMVFVFGAFVFGDFREIKLIGLGLATAVFIDATIVRLVLVPATMELLGDRNWWLPAWLDRILPRFEIEGGRPAAEAPQPELVAR